MICRSSTRPRSPLLPLAEPGEQALSWEACDLANLEPRHACILLGPTVDRLFRDLEQPSYLSWGEVGWRQWRPTITVAGSGNSDRSLSGNSGRPRQALR